MIHHTPKTTRKALIKFNESCKLNFYDSSYKNDSADSLEVEIKEDVFLKVFIPNSKKNEPSNEFFNTYILIFSGKDEVIFETKKIKKMINFINKNCVITFK
jgi:hypothetical protein